MNDSILERLFALQDLPYKAFQCRLMPTVNPDAVIGVRTPELRRLAKAVMKEDGAADFLSHLPHGYYEENNLHAFLIEQIRDYDDCIAALDRFLPYVDNWATCDMMRPVCFARHTDALLPQIRLWLSSPHTYTVRFALGMLMTHYLDEHFTPEILETAAEVTSGEYYINMMIAWFFATALAKQYNSAAAYIEQNRLPVWVHNKAIQKAIESNRIPKETKEYLRSKKRKDYTAVELPESAVPQALALAEKVFMQAVAPGYSRQGTEQFCQFLHTPEQIRKLRFFGVFEKKSLVGMIALRQEHISLFFVLPERQKQGIGRLLFDTALRQTGISSLTVNAAPGAEPVYRALGFAAVGGEECSDGIRYIPMVFPQPESGNIKIMQL